MPNPKTKRPNRWEVRPRFYSDFTTIDGNAMNYNQRADIVELDALRKKADTAKRALLFIAGLSTANDTPLSVLHQAQDAAAETLRRNGWDYLEGGVK